MSQPSACQQGPRIPSVCVSTSFKFLEYCQLSQRREREPAWRTLENTALLLFHRLPKLSHGSPPNSWGLWKCKLLSVLMPVSLHFFDCMKLVHWSIPQEGLHGHYYAQVPECSYQSIVITLEYTHTHTYALLWFTFYKISGLEFISLKSYSTVFWLWFQKYAGNLPI